MKIVGIIGGSGYIDDNVVSLFLNQNFDVKISTLDIKKKENYHHLMELEHAENLYVCELDPSIKSALNSFTKGCDIVIFMNPSEI